MSLWLKPPVNKLWDVESPLIEDHAEDPSPGLYKLLFGADGDLPAGLPGLDHQNHAINLSAEDTALGRAVDWGPVKDHVIVPFPHPIQKLLKPVGFKKRKKLRIGSTTGNDVEVPGPYLDGAGPTTIPGQKIRQSGDGIDFERGMEPRSSQIRIDHKNFNPGIHRQGDRKIGGRCRHTVAPGAAGKENALDRAITISV